MQFAYQDLGHRSRGEIVEVTLSGNAANVRLMDSSNFSNYRRGKRHRFYGGQARRSPVHLQIPYSGHWYVTVDFGGYKGRVKWGVQVLPGPLKPIRDSSLASVPSLVRQIGGDNGIVPDAETGKVYDVFISHASEDKDDFVRPLAHGLQAEGLTVWYDEFELRAGDNLRRKIDRGLASSRTGLIVLSQAFLHKGWVIKSWAGYELDGIVSKSNTGDQQLLPIWHGITQADLMSYSPSLTGVMALNTAHLSVDEIAAEVADLIHSRSLGEAG